MAAFEFAMWTPDRRKIDLAEILESVPGNSWVWNVVEYEGIGGTAAGYQPLDFEAAARVGVGVELTSSEFQELGSDIRDLWWLVAVAQSPTQRVSAGEVARRDFSKCRLVLEGEDSGRWIVRSPTSDPMGDAALRRIRTAYSHLAL